MGAVCSKRVRVSALGQCVLTAQSFIVGTGDLLVDVECSGFQCVLEAPRFLGYQVVFKESGCPRTVMANL